MIIGFSLFTIKPRFVVTGSHVREIPVVYFIKELRNCSHFSALDVGIFSKSDTFQKTRNI